jgi:hypothetical protein
MRKPSKTTLRKKLDAIWSRIIRSKGACEVCGKSENLNAHHLIGRRDLSLRWVPMNGVCLCAGCHTFKLQSAHQDPLWFHEWLVANKVQAFLDDLTNMRELKTYSLSDLQEKYADLKRILKDL